MSARRRSLDSRRRLIESLGSLAGSMCWEKKDQWGVHETVCETEACADRVAGGDWLGGGRRNGPGAKREV